MQFCSAPLLFNCFSLNQQIFEGNQNPEIPTLGLLPVPTVARFIRINPQTWYPNGTICLRTEILGCRVDGERHVDADSTFSWLSNNQLSLQAVVNTIRWLPLLVDSANRLYSEEDRSSKDPLDFRHHNYKEMRKVGVVPMSLGASRARALISLTVCRFPSEIPDLTLWRLSLTCLFDLKSSWDPWMRSVQTSHTSTPSGKATWAWNCMSWWSPITPLNTSWVSAL